MKVKGIGIARTNKERVSYKQQMGAMWTLEEWLLSVLNPEQKSEYYAQYVRVDGLKTILSQPEGNKEFNGFLYIAKGSCGEPTNEARAETKRAWAMPCKEEEKRSLIRSICSGLRTEQKEIVAQVLA